MLKTLALKGKKAILDNTPNKRACDGHFPLPVKGKAIPSHRALRSPTALQSTAEPHVHPSHGALPRPAGILILDWQGGKVDRRHPRTAFSSTGKGETESQTQAMFPRPPFPRQW